MLSSTFHAGYKTPPDSVSRFLEGQRFFVDNGGLLPMRLPGCRRQRELRCWSLHRLSEEAGVHWLTARKADLGEGIRSDAAVAIMAAFERVPVPRVARELEPAS